MSENFKQYWDRNIENWGGKYLDISHGHETFDRPAWFTAAYNATIGHLERRLMKERYRRTLAFLDRYLKPGDTFSDLGCGTGIFVIEALRRGASHVNAVDFSESSLSATRQAVERHFPAASVSYTRADLQTGEIPLSSVSLAMGVTPYMTDIAAFIANAVPKTKVLCVQYTDPKHWASRIRTSIPALDVRSLQCHDKSRIDALYFKHGGIKFERDGFASGYIDVVANIEHLYADLSTYKRSAPPLGAITCPASL